MFGTIDEDKKGTFETPCTSSIDIKEEIVDNKELRPPQSPSSISSSVECIKNEEQQETTDDNFRPKITEYKVWLRKSRLAELALIAATCSKCRFFINTDMKDHEAVCELLEYCGDDNQCVFCDLPCPSRPALQRHISGEHLINAASKDGPKYFVLCKNCLKGFEPLDFWEHKRTSVCKMSPQTKQIVCDYKEDESHNCPHCFMEFETNGNSLHVHKMTCKRNPNRAKNFATCPTCQKKVPTFLLSSHNARCRGSVKINNVAENDLEPKSKRKVTFVKCNFCFKTLDTTTYIRIHAITCPQMKFGLEESRTCNHCSKELPTSRSLLHEVECIKNPDKTASSTEDCPGCGASTSLKRLHLTECRPELKAWICTLIDQLMGGEIGDKENKPQDPQPPDAEKSQTKLGDSSFSEESLSPEPALTKIRQSKPTPKTDFNETSDLKFVPLKKQPIEQSQGPENYESQKLQQQDQFAFDANPKKINPVVSVTGQGTPTAKRIKLSDDEDRKPAVVSDKPNIVTKIKCPKCTTSLDNLNTAICHLYEVHGLQVQEMKEQGMKFRKIKISIYT